MASQGLWQTNMKEDTRPNLYPDSWWSYCSSHYIPKLLEYAQDNNIMILGYLPHCTHTLQELDVVCFARMKDDWKQVINGFETLHKAKITRVDFTSLFDQAYHCVFTKDTIEAAFWVTRVCPFNCTIITEKQMKPRQATSTKGSFAIIYTSPVHTIITSFKTYQPTAFDISPTNTHLQPLPDRYPSLPAVAMNWIMELPHLQISSSSTPKQFQDPMIDPTLISLEMPSK